MKPSTQRDAGHTGPADAGMDAGAEDDPAAGRDAGEEAGPCVGKDDGAACGSNMICVRESCKAPACGDGVLSAGEACDDGNLMDADGCSPACVLTAACGNGKVEAGEDCDDGNALDLDGCSSTCTTACEVCEDAQCRNFGGNGVDFLKLCVDAEGTAQAGPGRGKAKKELCAAVLTCAHRTGCAKSSTDYCYCGDTPFNECSQDFRKVLGPCKDEIEAAAESTDPDLVTLRLSDPDLAIGAAYNVLTCEAVACLNECFAPCKGKADGASCAEDGRKCVAQSCPGLCNDGILTRDEECDPSLDSANCTPKCKLAKCGDGLVWPGHESCDDGNATDDGNGCSATCQKNGVCGNGKKEPVTGESCDDGNTMNGDGCSSLCSKEPKCGDGVLDYLESCDDGNTKDGDNCPAACGRCGDGILNAGEICDDGNLIETDVCTSNCQPNK